MQALLESLILVLDGFIQDGRLAVKNSYRIVGNVLVMTQ